MKARLLLIVAAAALIGATLAATQLGQAADRKPTASSSARVSAAVGDVFFDRFGDVMPIAGSPGSPTLVVETSSLPAGSYAMAAKVQVVGTRDSFARAVCQLRFPGWTVSTTDTGSATVGLRRGAAEDQVISLLNARMLLNGGRVRVVCWPEEMSGTHPSVSETSLLVTTVTSISP